jgi:hypothetical protein
MSFRVPKMIPTNSSHEERCSLSRALQLCLKFPVIGLPRFPNRPLQRHPSPKLSSTPFPQSPRQMRLLLVPRQGPHGERLHLQTQWLIHSFIAIRVTSREPSDKKRGNILSPSTKAYIQWGVAWFPKRIINDTAITTPVPCSLQHDTLHLGLGRPEPR